MDVRGLKMLTAFSDRWTLKLVIRFPAETGSRASALMPVCTVAATSVELEGVKLPAATTTKIWAPLERPEVLTRRFVKRKVRVLPDPGGSAGRTQASWFWEANPPWNTLGR